MPEVEIGLLEGSLDEELAASDQGAAEPAFSPTAGLIAQADQNLQAEASHWQPMLELFGPEVAGQFLWAVTTDGIETYEHRETFRFLHIDSLTGECLNQQCQVVSTESALQYALQPRTTAASAPVAQDVFFAEQVAPREYEELGAQPDGTVIEPQIDPQIEPSINGFMRKLEMAEAGPGRISLAAPLPPVPQADTYFVPEAVLPAVRQSWLSKALSWSNPLTAKAQDAGSSQGYNSQELELANFTRRPSAL